MSTQLAVRGDVVEGEILDNAPNMVISNQEAMTRIKDLQSFVKTQMVQGIDYGLIPGAGNKSVLFKPGAEKLNAIYGYMAKYEVVDRVQDWVEGFFHFEVKVTLINKSNGEEVGEGIGSCNTREKRYRNQNAADIHNTVLKMAKKRAYLDATLAATRASGVFDSSASTDATLDEGAVEQRIDVARNYGFAMGQYDAMLELAGHYELKRPNGEGFPVLGNVSVEVFEKGCKAIREALGELLTSSTRPESKVVDSSKNLNQAVHEKRAVASNPTPENVEEANRVFDQAANDASDDAPIEGEVADEPKPKAGKGKSSKETEFFSAAMEKNLDVTEANFSNIMQAINASLVENGYSGVAEIGDVKAGQWIVLKTQLEEGKLTWPEFQLS